MNKGDIVKVVNIDNEFELFGHYFKIPDDNELYKVASKCGEVDEYENYSNADTVSIKIDENLSLRVYDEAGDEIEGVKVIKK